MGVKQGALCSPLLFSLYIDELAGLLGGGVSVGNV